MTTPLAIGIGGGLSALGRRLGVAAARPDEPWLNLAENVPEWPTGRAAQPRIPRTAPFRYAPSQGDASLLATVARRESAQFGTGLVSPPHLLITNGGIHAIALTIRDAARRGFTHAVGLTPMFHSVFELFAASGIAVSGVPVGTSGTVDVDLFSDLCDRPGTIAYLNLPHNPTGVALAPELDRLVRRLADRDDVLVLYDAVYDAFVFTADARPTPVALAVASPDVVVVNSMSKNFGRPGDRVGWIISHPDTVTRLVAELEREMVAVNSIAQRGAVEVIRAGNERLVEAVAIGRAAYRRALATSGLPILAPLPAGGTQTWIDLDVPDIEAFADFALDAHHLVLTTSSNYQPVIAGRMRYPTGLHPSILEAGLRCLGDALADWLRRGATAAARQDEIRRDGS